MAIMNAQPSFRPAGPLSASPLAPYTGPWNARLAAHLLRRAGFGGSPSDVARLARLSSGEAVEAMLFVPAVDPLPALPPLVDDESALRVTVRNAKHEMAANEMSPDAYKIVKKQRGFERHEQERADVAWWLNRMLATNAPLQEKMTLFLHGHFATKTRSKGIYGLDIAEQNALLRRHALGNFRELVHQISKDRAMLKWLDGARNVKAQPNENYARELMELFTLGIGNYTEHDVRESARAFTGWTFRKPDGPVYFDAAEHDDGVKTFLGRTGQFDGDAIVDIIMAQPAASKFLAGKLLNFFVYNEPEPELVEALAAVLRKHDFDLKPVLATLFQSQVFYSDRSYRALVKSPVEFVVGTCRLLGVSEAQPEFFVVLTRMGQLPFRPPSVKGWDGGASWLSSGTMLARANFVSSVLAVPATMQSTTWLTQGAGFDSAEASHRLVDGILQGDASPESVARLKTYLDDADSGQKLSVENFDQRMRGAAYLTMAMPAYQLA